MKQALFILLSFSLAGCATMPRRMARLALGDSKQQAFAILGKPDGARVMDNVEGWTYSNRIMNTWGAKDRTDYYVIFADDKLTAYGNGPVRTAPSDNVSFIVPLPSYQEAERPMPPPPPLMPTQGGYK